MAKSRLPGDRAVCTQPRIRFTSGHGSARGGFSNARTRGPITQHARSRCRRPVLRRKRKNDLRQPQVVASVRLDSRCASCLTNASRSEMAVLFTDLPRVRSSDRNAPATSKSRRRVPSATPRWQRRNSQYPLRRRDFGTSTRFGLHSGTGAPRRPKANAQAWRAFLAIRRVPAHIGPFVLGPIYEQANRRAPCKVSSASGSMLRWPQ
jgi:hypothetical protein